MKPGRPSQTALLIAKSTAAARYQPHLAPYVDPESVEASARWIEDGWGPASLRRIQSRTYQRAHRWAERRVLPGIQLHYALRKKQLQQWTEDAVAAGIRQFLIIGAGFDTLALRLAARWPDSRWVEVDHPDTQGLKRESLIRRNQCPPNLHFQPVDLAVSENGFLPPASLLDPEQPTLVIAEGVLMYLEEPVVREFFSGLADHFHTGCQVAFTLMAPDSRGLLRFHYASRWVEWWLAWRREPFLWGADEDGLRPLLHAAGFEVMETCGDSELRASWLRPEHQSEPLAVGEWLCLAERRDD